MVPVSLREYPNQDSILYSLLVYQSRSSILSWKISKISIMCVSCSYFLLPPGFRSFSPKFAPDCLNHYLLTWPNPRILICVFSHIPHPKILLSMTTSNNNGKQKDRVAYYGEVMLNGVTSVGPSILANQKKKSYRARGCRGGASRKGRNKHSLHHEDEENDPRHLNTNSENTSFNGCAPDENKVVVASNNRDTDEHASGNRSYESKSISQKKMRTLPILPNSSGLSLRLGNSNHTLKTSSEAELLDQSQTRSNSGRYPTTIHTNINCNSAPRGITKSGSHAIARPNSTPYDGSDGGTGVGFSFFCISPSSFLTGRRKAK